MKNILVTGGTVFISKYIAKFFTEKGYKVYVLNRGTKEQIDGVTLIKGDRNNLQETLRGYSFDWIIDVAAYNQKDIKNLLEALDGVKNYVFISSSAVYPETNVQPFTEEQNIDVNSIWGKYGTDKIESEQYLLSKVPNAYILRPAYIYGPMQNIYREPFVFECALKNRKFYIPDDGTMKLQFFHIDDLAKVIQKIVELCPEDHIINSGNEECIDINTFVELCYKVVGTPLEKVYVTSNINQREYFSFHNYEYKVDVTRQKKLLPITKDIFEGLKESYEWYKLNQQEIIKKDYIKFIDENIAVSKNMKI